MPVSSPVFISIVLALGGKVGVGVTTKALHICTAMFSSDEQLLLPWMTAIG